MPRCRRRYDTLKQCFHRYHSCRVYIFADFMAPNRATLLSRSPRTECISGARASVAAMLQVVARGYQEESFFWLPIQVRESARACVSPHIALMAPRLQLCTASFFLLVDAFGNLKRNGALEAQSFAELSACFEVMNSMRDS